MKVFLLFLFAVFAYGDASVGTLEIAVANKCLNNAPNENAFDEVNDKFLSCSMNAYSLDPPTPMEDHEGFCNYLKNSGFYGCVENLTTSVSQCLDDSEKYLPNFLLRGLNSSYDELCGAQGLETSNLIFTELISSHSCISKIARNELQCLAEIHLVRNLEDKGILNLNKNDVCLDLDALQTCIKSAVKMECNDNQNDIKAVDLMFRPFTEECNDLLHD